MAYAKGTHALAVCDRCGWSYPYLSMKVEWNNLKVCSECYEPRQPQDTPARITADPVGTYFTGLEGTSELGTITVTIS